MYRRVHCLTPLIFNKIPCSAAGYIKTGLSRKISYCYENTGIFHLNTVNHRWYSETATNYKVVDYEEVVKATSNKNILIIDVREPDEVKELGTIPNSINIPLGTVTTTLNEMPDKEFEKVFKRPKPSQDAEIIFYCMAGRRSAKAQQDAINLGFTNTKNYLGSWTEWASKVN